MERRPYTQKRQSPHGAHAPKTSWNNVAKWYGGYMKGEDTLQETLVFPNALRLLGVGKGKKYVDIACGEGSFAVHIAKLGGEVVGIDVAATLVRAAETKQIRGAKFVVGDARKFAEKFVGVTFDGATCILAVQNIDDAGAVFANAARVLKKDSRFVIVLNHPAFRIPRQSSWGFDESKKMQYRRVDMYMSEHEIPIQAHPGSAPSLKTFSYHRPLSAYIADLAKAGFVVDALEEWVSNRESDSGPRAKTENRARNEFPMFLAIRAVKR